MQAALAGAQWSEQRTLRVSAADSRTGAVVNVALLPHGALQSLLRREPSRRSLAGGGGAGAGSGGGDAAAAEDGDSGSGSGSGPGGGGSGGEDDREGEEGSGSGGDGGGGFVGGSSYKDVGTLGPSAAGTMAGASAIIAAAAADAGAGATTGTADNTGGREAAAGHTATEQRGSAAGDAALAEDASAAQTLTTTEPEHPWAKDIPELFSREGMEAYGARRKAEDEAEQAFEMAVQALAGNSPPTALGDCVEALVSQLGQASDAGGEREGGGGGSDGGGGGGGGDDGNGDGGGKAKRARIAVVVEAIWRKAYK